jgi:hypothetical protein
MIMQHGKRFGAISRFLVVALTGATLVAVTPACVVRGRARAVWVVDVPPPAPRVVRVTPRPGHVWIHGHWERHGSRWVWSNGYWVRARSGHAWRPGAWVQVGARWQWNEGRWERGDHTPDRARVRDHRSDPAPTPPPVVNPGSVRDRRTH